MWRKIIKYFQKYKWLKTIIFLIPTIILTRLIENIFNIVIWKFVWEAVKKIFSYKLEIYLPYSILAMIYGIGVLSLYVLLKISRRYKIGEGKIKGLPIKWKYFNDRNGNLQIVDYQVFCPNCSCKIIQKRDATDGFFWQCPNCKAKSPKDFDFHFSDDLEVLIQHHMRKK